jgi:autotransporter-associated beta strand protein
VEIVVAGGYRAIVKNRLPSIPVKTHFTTSPITRRSFQGLATAILLASPLHAANISWSASEGDFNDTGNWSGGTLPGGGDTAIVGNGGTVWLTDVRTVGALNLPNGSFGITPGQMLTSGGATTIGQQVGGLGTLELDNGQFFASGSITVGTGGGSGLFNFYNGFINRAGAGSVVVGEGTGSSGEFVQSSGFMNCMTSWTIGSGAGATGLLDFGGHSAANAHDWFVVGAGGASGTFKLSGNGSFNKLPTMPNTHVAIGRGNGSTAAVEQTGGYFINMSTDTYLGESGNATATWTLSGSSSIAVFATLELGHADAASATFEHNGGTLTANRIAKGSSTGTTSLVFNGGTLTPRANDPDFISGIDNVTIEDGGLFIDTTPQVNSGFTEHEIGFAVDLLDGGGGLTKRGVGSLTYEGTGYYTGATVVEGGTLYIDGELTDSDVTVQEGGTLAGGGTIGGSVTAAGKLAPGHGVGTLTGEGNVAVTGTLAIELTASSGDVLAVAGDLNVEGATLSIELPDGPPLSQPYVIATYGTRSGGNFAAIQGGDGYTIDYAYQGNKIAVTPGVSPYANWASNYAWANEGDELADADPDGDGFANALEFFLDGDPLVAGPPSGKPSGTVSGGRFLFTFERNAGASSVVPVVEYGTSLDLPSVAANGVNGVIISTEASPGGEVWAVSLPLPPAGRLFARLKVEL